MHDLLLIRIILNLESTHVESSNKCEVMAPQWKITEGSRLSFSDINASKTKDMVISLHLSCGDKLTFELQVDAL